MELRALSQHCGTEILGIDVRAIDDATLESLKAEVAERGVVMIRDQALRPEDHIDFARRWGGIDVNNYFPANGGYRSPGHALTVHATPHAWGTAVNIFKIGDTMLDQQDVLAPLVGLCHPFAEVALVERRDVRVTRRGDMVAGLALVEAVGHRRAGRGGEEEGREGEARHRHGRVRRE